MGSLLSVTLAMEDGRKQMPNFRPSRTQPRRQRIQAVLVRASSCKLPVQSRLKQGWAFAWRSLITAEMLYLSLGLVRC